MVDINSLTNLVSGANKVDPLEAVDKVAASGTNQAIVQLILGFGFFAALMGGIYYLYVRFKQYDVEFDVWEIGGDGNRIRSKDTGRVRLNHNDIRLWHGSVNLPLPDRKYMVKTNKGKWSLCIEKFGAKDYAYLMPSLTEEGIILKAVESQSAEWANLQLQKNKLKYSTVKWYQTPQFNMILIGIITIIVTYIVFSKLAGLSSAFQASAQHCADLAKEIAVAQSRGSIITQG